MVSHPSTSDLGFHLARHVRVRFRARVRVSVRVWVRLRLRLRLRLRSFSPGQVLEPSFIQAPCAASRVGKMAPPLLHHRLLILAHVMPGISDSKALRKPPTRVWLIKLSHLETAGMPKW